MHHNYWAHALQSPRSTTREAHVSQQETHMLQLEEPPHAATKETTMKSLLASVMTQHSKTNKQFKKIKKQETTTHDEVKKNNQLKHRC